MKTLNKVQLKGVIGQDAQVNTVEGRKVANFSLATDWPWKDRNGEWQHDTDWHNLVAWEGYGIAPVENLKKGTRVYACGRLHTRKYTDKSGTERYITEILCDELDIIYEASEAKPATNGTRGQQAAPQSRAYKNESDEDF